MKSRFARKDFLEALFGEYVSKHDGFIRIVTVRHFDRRISTRYFPKLETLAREQYAENQHVFFGVCPHEGMRADKSGIRYMVALWAGLDLASEGYSGKTQYFKDMSYAAKAVRSFPLAPSIVVESGWGVHLYWLLKGVTEISDPKRIEKLLSSLSDYFQCKRIIPIDSILRLPDTFNSKHQQSVVKCTVKYLNGEFRYDLEEFEKLSLMSADTNVADATEQDLAETVVLQNGSDLAVSEEESAPDAHFGVQNVGNFVGQELPDSRVIPLAKPASRPSVAPGQERAGTVPRVHSDTNDSYVSAEAEEVDDAETVLVVAEGSADSIADEIVEKVVQKLTGQLMDQLVDQIVEKLYQRITNSSGQK